MNTVGEIARVLKGLKSAVIFSHSRPDGDAVGSSLALSRALTKSGIENQVVNESAIPDCFFVLEGAKEILTFPTLEAQAYIAVDSSDENRFGELTKTFLKGAGKGKITVNIDHHVSNTRFCKYNFVRNRSSNCENVAEIISAMGIEEDEEISSALLAGIITDSGGFSHNDVNGDTLRAAARACDKGADICTLSYELIKKQSLARAKFYAKTISSLRFLSDNKLAVATVTRADLSAYGLTSDASSGIVDFALGIDEVEVSACLLEVKNGQYKVSLRSKHTDVNAIAATFGGGGHIRAAGCMLFGAYEDVVDRLRYAVYQHSEGV